MPSPIKRRLAESYQDLFVPREMSWLQFNARVLQEAADESVPVIERLRYLGIFSNNMDEFYRVRVAEVRRLVSVSSGKTQQQAKDLLADIQARVVALQKEFEPVYNRVLRDLRARRIYMINEQQLDAGQAQFVQDYFTHTVLPELEPILLRQEQSIPPLNDESIYLAIDIRSGEQYNYAVVEVPTGPLDRFVEIPRRKGKAGKVFIALDNIMRACLPQMFRGVFAIDEAAAYCFKFSRDAELEIDPGISESLIHKMASSLKQRRKADAVRFVYDEKMPQRLLDYLSSRFGFGKYDSMIPGGRYHNSKDFMSFPNVGPKYLEFKPLPPIRIPRLDEPGSLFDSIREQDVFLFYPYHPFDYIIDLLKTAALDPHVTCIKICLYRVAKASRVIDALLNAVQNGKRVLAVVELAARFDEEANISWAQRLTENGIEVIFGIPGLKVHSKLLLIERRENSNIRYYSHIGTGNFNEKTARLYTDFTLLTHNQDIGKDVYNVFDFLQFNYKRPEYKLLYVSPHSTRSGLEQLIDREISNALDGYRASMTLKCNNLVDTELVEKLYEASEAGVKIRLIVRGMCSLKPGVPGLSENIRAISIVDRFLEHPRAYVFYNRGKPRYLIGSADLMTRNIDYRVEVLCPVLDQTAQMIIQDVLDQQWNDNVKARIIDETQSNQYAKAKPKSARIRSQESIHRYLATGKLPRYPKSRMTEQTRRRRVQD
ncbi:polyphosphate kinase 1 [Parahaliea sp. F7430]|uniref:Polyphosphate kinase n=1 Tax=Sediminihaliea albiluteola TaxID=2758564 RepID=A0A7W2TV32_9GAMM|nr:polyphosphate kinase 1 [Sediminihaliea albiluteola]MBA6412478.1 polyphosphate kinase 1 [Sediminihaliea albiluteola]